MKKMFLGLVAVIALVAQTTTAQALSITEVDAVLTNGQYIVEFKVDEALDLSQSSADDVTIQYFYEFDDGERTAIINKTTNQPLVKDKSWDGYLWGKDTQVNYSQGVAANATYLDAIPAGTVLQTMINPSHALEMDYVSGNWDTGKLVAVITVKTATSEVSYEAAAGVPDANPSPITPTTPTTPTSDPITTSETATKNNPPTGDIDMGKTIIMIGSSLVLLGAAIIVLKKKVF